MMNDYIGGESDDNSNDSSRSAEIMETGAESVSIRDMEVVTNGTSTQGQGQVTAENSGYGRKPRQKKSQVWNEFEEYKEGDEVKGIQCKHCKNVFKMSKSGSTTQYQRHLKTCPKRSVIIAGQRRLNLQRGTLGSSNIIKPWKYDQSRIRELISHMVMVHELPFTFAEYELFNLLMKESSPDFRKISRTTLKSDCITSYQNEKKKLTTSLNSVKRVSITTDIWRSGQKIEYMVVTCHYVCDWKLHKKMLNFCYIPPPHNGPAVCEVLNQCLMDWNLTNKLATVTADNASYNDAAVKNLKEVLSFQRKLPFDGKFFHVRCCAHIVNILVQDGLLEIGDIIHNVRETVKHIDKSSQRIKIFGDVVKSWRLSGKKLILDCPTRWNSTYQMLACALEFKTVFGYYEEKDSSYKNKPSEEDWIKVEKICSFLQIFNDITEIISGTQYPTSNLFLPELANIKEELEDKSKSRDAYIRDMANKMKAKFDKYWGSNNILISIAAVLDPRNKLQAVRILSKSLCNCDLQAHEYVSKVRDTLYELYNEYVELHTNVNSESHGVRSRDDGSGPSNVTNMVGKGISRMRRKLDDLIRGSDASEYSKSELDTYLEDGVVRVEDVDGYFDPLDWWKGNSSKFRVLSRLACDILAIPITSVASEAAFSAGGRVIDNYRASLGVDTVQMLLCGEDWLRSYYNIKKKIRSTEQEMKEILF
ncbi:hypothetical protein QQ045_019807 [Rhodiola kirilowii]